MHDCKNIDTFIPGKMGKFLEKSGNFVSEKKWEPCKKWVFMCWLLNLLNNLLSNRSAAWLALTYVYINSLQK